MSATTNQDSDSPLPLPILPPLSLKLEQEVKIEEQNGTMLRDPSETELCKCIIMLKQCLPYCRLDRVIILLNEHLVMERKELREASKKKDRLLQEDDYLSDEDITEMQKKKMQQEYARKFENSQANPRFYEEREIAKLFCSKGYGYPTAREYLGQSITPNRYNNVITTIVRLSYRKLQFYIIKYIQPRLPMISREELKMIKTPLVNCRSWMNERQAQNFHRFVKLTYKIATDQPQREIALQLHEAIMGQLKKRNVTYRPHRRGNDPNAWTPDMDTHLISNYLSHPIQTDLQQHLTALFPTHRTCFELGRLRLRLERLLRLALRKIYCDRDKFGLNEPATLSEYLVCKICSADGAIDVRKRLLSYYLDSDTNAMKLRWVREVMEEYIKASRLEVEEIQDSSCQLVLKQQLKTEVNQSKGTKKEEALDVNKKIDKKEQQSHIQQKQNQMGFSENQPLQLQEVDHISEGIQQQFQQKIQKGKQDPENLKSYENCKKNQTIYGLQSQINGYIDNESSRSNKLTKMLLNYQQKRQLLKKSEQDENGNQSDDEGDQNNKKREKDPDL